MAESNEENEIVSTSFNFDIQPYMFEPVFDDESDHGSEESEAEESDEDERDGLRLQDTEWCDCGNCIIMPTALECLCCREIDIVDMKRGELSCITEHEGFFANCLNRDVVEVSLFEYVTYEGPLDDNEPIHEAYRYVAYRRFVRWIYQRLGRRRRKVLPACVVTKIRNAFPSEQYTGFKYAVPS